MFHARKDILKREITQKDGYMSKVKLFDLLLGFWQVSRKITSMERKIIRTENTGKTIEILEKADNLRVKQIELDKNIAKLISKN